MHTSEPVTALDETALGAAALSVNWLPTVPSPPERILVPAGRPPPATYMPTSSVPEVTALTVSVVEPCAMEALTTGSEAPATAPVTAPVVCTLSVHAQGKALVAEHPPATMMVPAAKPALVTVMPMTSEPEPTAVTESVVEPLAAFAVTLAPENVGAKPRRAGQKKPAGHATCATPPAYVVQKKPAVQGFASSAVFPARRQLPVVVHREQAVALPTLKVPAGHTPPVVVMAAKITAAGYGALSVYTPAPPVPEPNAAMNVPAATPVKLSTWPTASAPTGAGEAATVSVAVPAAMEPVKLIEPVPSGQNAPAGHAAPTDTPCAQNVPAAHGLEVATVLPAAVQKPGAQREPAGAAEDEPAGQKKPTSHSCVLGQAASSEVCPKRTP